ncbi:hypothetical protein Droror1_Dr00014814 [Drosera rotundifolia]
MDDDDDHHRSSPNSPHLPSSDPSPTLENPIAEQQDNVSCHDLTEIASKDVATDSAMVRLRGRFRIFWDERRLMARGDSEKEESCGGEREWVLGLGLKLYARDFHFHMYVFVIIFEKLYIWIIG